VSVLSKETILAKVRINPDTGCWEWTACLNNRGYGRLRTDRDEMLAHRASWIAWNGEIQNGLWVLHKCDNRKCVNPNHLFLGNHEENMRDMFEKGHYSPRSKLTKEQVFKILTDERPSKVLAGLFGVCKSTINNLRSRRTYGDWQA